MAIFSLLFGTISLVYKTLVVGLSTKMVDLHFVQ